MDNNCLTTQTARSAIAVILCVFLYCANPPASLAGAEEIKQEAVPESDSSIKDTLPLEPESGIAGPTGTKHSGDSSGTGNREDEDTENPKDMLDTLHETTTEMFQDAVFKTDNLLAANPEGDLTPLNKSKFNVAVSVKIDKDDDDRFKSKLDLDIKAKINLPKSKERLSIFIDTSSPDELPGADPDEVENNLFAGIMSTIGRRKVPFGTFRLGVKARIPPVGYMELLFRHHINWKYFHIVPQLKGYWLSDDGFGEVTSLIIECLPTANTLLSTVSAAKWSEITHGVEWEQSILFGYRSGSDFKRSSQSVLLKGSVFGHKSGESVIDLYRVSLMYRKSIYKRWLFMEVGPELEFPNEKEWEPTPSIRIGVDMLFWPPEDFLY